MHHLPGNALTPSPQPGLKTDAGSDDARLFVALWPGDDLAHALHASCGLSAGDTHTRSVAWAKLHLTLHFLGPVPRRRLPELSAALQVPWLPFDLVFRRCEVWPHGLLVALPDALPSPLAQLHAQLGQVLRHLGLPTDERAFRPHITLARRYAQRLGAPQPPAAAPLHWPVRDYVLAESVAAPRSAYHVLQHYR